MNETTEQLTLKPPGSYSVKMTAYMRKTYTYNIQLQRTQQTAHNACSVYYIVNISGTAESGYNCIETNTMSQARRPFTLENLWFHNNVILDDAQARSPYHYMILFPKRTSNKGVRRTHSLSHDHHQLVYGALKGRLSL